MTANIGKIRQVTGAVVDVQFEGKLPEILTRAGDQESRRPPGS